MKTEAEALVSSLRDEIEELDTSLVKLLRRRVTLVLAVNFAKHACGRPVIDEGRERRLIMSVARHETSDVVRVYREVIHACREAALRHSVDGGDQEVPAKRPDGR